MTFNGVTFGVFMVLFVLVTGMGFVASRWRRAKNEHQLDEWALGGRGFGGFITWFLLGGDLYSAYTLIAVPAAIFSIGAFGFYAVPNAVVLYSLGFLFLPRLVRLAHEKGYVTLTDFVNDRFKSQALGLAITLTGLLATLPYLALQLVGLEVVFASMGIQPGPTASWIVRDLPLFIAFGVLAAYTYSSGIRAPALIAFLKDGLTYIVVIVAVIVIPIKLGGFGQIFADAGAAIAERTNSPDPEAATISVNASVYMTLAPGSGMAFFLYPHAITGVFAARGARTVRRNMSVLPIYTVLLGFVALLGIMALAAGIKPLNGNPQFAVPQLLKSVPLVVRRRRIRRDRDERPCTGGNHGHRRREPGQPEHHPPVLPLRDHQPPGNRDLQGSVRTGQARGAGVRPDPRQSVRPQFPVARRYLDSADHPHGAARPVHRTLRRQAGTAGRVGSRYRLRHDRRLQRLIPPASHFGGSTTAPFFLSSPMYIAISALILNLVVTLVWSGIT